MDPHKPTPTEELWKSFSVEHGLKRWTELRRNPRLFKRFVEALRERKVATIIEKGHD